MEKNSRVHSSSHRKKENGDIVKFPPPPGGKSTICFCIVVFPLVIRLQEDTLHGRIYQEISFSLGTTSVALEMSLIDFYSITCLNNSPRHHF